MKRHITSIVKDKLTEAGFYTDRCKGRVRAQIVQRAINANFQMEAVFKHIELEFIFLLKAQRLNNADIKSAILRLREIECINEICERLKELIIKEVSEFESSETQDNYVKEDAYLSLLFDEMDITAGLRRWVEDEYAPVDARIEVTKHRKVRRYDSLSRIIASQSSSVSVCGAVTIDTRSAQPRLIISANMSSAVAEPRFLEEIKFKLSVLKSFFSTYQFGLADLPDESRCHELSLKLFHQLFPSYLASPQTGQQVGTLEQAVFKLTHTVLYDPETFSEEEKKAFLGAPVILLPSVIGDHVEMLITHITPRGFIQSHESLPSSLEAKNLRFIHAEQLIATYLYNYLKIPRETKFIFGISKLCCATCSGFLEAYPNVLFRGHHQQQYEGVINLNTGVRSASSTLKKGPTAPESSPMKTPYKSRTSGALPTGASLEDGETGVPRVQRVISFKKFFLEASSVSAASTTGRQASSSPTDALLAHGVFSLRFPLPPIEEHIDTIDPRLGRMA
ncbi:hypothetical protein [Legionella yabuuchiae]|uniref:hypothetical protein n=1 Tax=Legionella yabuuchiae TaxID=376727 RepID=UPI0010556265|nr:hypothetical protein [Legionella yabuuchiae]